MENPSDRIDRDALVVGTVVPASGRAIAREVIREAAAKDGPAVLSKVLELLVPLDEDQRRRVLSAACVYFKQGKVTR